MASSASPSPTTSPSAATSRAARSAAELRARLDELSAQQPRPAARDRRRGGAHGRHVRGRDAAPARARPRDGPQGRRRRGRPRRRRRPRDAWTDWARTPWEDRAAVFLRAADLLAGPWRSTLNAATMLGQSKTAHQAEIDAACELIDFWRFNVEYMTRIYGEQPISSPGRLEPDGVPPARGLRLRGHAVQLHLDRRQPADLGGADGQHRGLEAGLDGRLQRALPDEALRGRRAAAGRDQPRPRLRRRGRRPRARRARTSPASTSPARPPSSRGCGRPSARTSRATASYPRIVGETGGKDFIVAHPSADAGGARDGDRPRLVRVPGPEVLGRLARLRAVEPLAGAARAARRARSAR